MNTALDKLLSLKGERLQFSTNHFGEINVTYEDAYIKDGIALLGVYGTGKTADEACESYINQINGESLVFHPISKLLRYECRILA